MIRRRSIPDAVGMRVASGLIIAALVLFGISLAIIAAAALGFMPYQ